MFCDVFSHGAVTDAHAPGHARQIAGRLARVQTFHDVDVAVIMPLAQLRQGRTKAGEFLPAGHPRPQFLKMLSFFRRDHARWPFGWPVTFQACLTSVLISHLTYRPPPWPVTSHNDDNLFPRSAKASGRIILKSFLALIFASTSPWRAVERPKTHNKETITTGCSTSTYCSDSTKETCGFNSRYASSQFRPTPHHGNGRYAP